MPTGITDFIATVNKTVTVEGEQYTITVPTLPSGVKMYLNDVEVVSGEVVTLTANAVIRMEFPTPQQSSFVLTYENQASALWNSAVIANGAVVTPVGSDNTLELIGATSIPAMTFNGSGITGFTLNGTAFTPDNLPYTFTPTAGVTNELFATGDAGATPYLTMAGTNINSVTVNNQPHEMPFRIPVTEDLHIAVAGEVYQVDILGIGGAKIAVDGSIVSDGNSEYHGVIDIEKDTFITFDGTHDLNLDGQYLHSISINGVEIPITSLPATIQNRKMSIDVSVSGNLPSEVNISGMYIQDAILDGVQLPIDDEGHLFYELITSEDSHVLNIVGRQDRQYGITWQDNGTTQIFMDGKLQQNGTTAMISKDVLVAAYPVAVPIHFEKPGTVKIDINGRQYNTNDFTILVDQATEIDITTETCLVTIDYADNSFSLEVPQGRIVLTAPHRDGWRFDGWSSTDVGIENSKSIRTVVDLEGKSNAHLVTHYERYKVWNKPDIWEN